MSVRILTLYPTTGLIDGTVDGSLASYQNVVGGPVEKVWSMPRTLGDELTRGGIDLVCNEEGLLRGLAPNIKWAGVRTLVGPLFFVRYNRDGNWLSLTDDDVSSLRSVMAGYLLRYRGLSPQQYSAVFRTPLDPAEQARYEEAYADRRARIDAYRADEAAAGLL